MRVFVATTLASSSLLWFPSPLARFFFRVKGFVFVVLFAAFKAIEFPKGAFAFPFRGDDGGDGGGAALDDFAR